MLEEAYRIFAMKENDHKGRYLEFRFANFLKLKYERELARIKIRKKVPNVGELDIVGLDSENHYCLMAECKDRPIRYEDVDKWLINIRRLYDLYGNRIKRAFIVGSKGYTPETLKRVEDLKNIDKKGRLNFIEGVTVTKAYHFAKWFADPNRPTNSDELDKVYIGLYDVREGKFNQVFP
jgi:hypothetical protein